MIGKKRSNLHTAAILPGQYLEGLTTPRHNMNRRVFLPRFCILFFAVVSILPESAASRQTGLSFLLTRAEQTHYDETTRYDEFIGFLDVIVRQHEHMHLTRLGYSMEGRAIPLVVFGKVADAGPDAVRESGKTRVYLQGNIHAGEVCGKEALMMLLREFASGQHETLLDSLVIMVVPMYNVDGNERVRLDNRPRQNGPVGGMGQRPNAQGLDLNRDHMKFRSPEARAVLRFMTRYDPHVSVDLHTTNGTRHAYNLTYAPPLNPNTPAPIDSLLRQDWLPGLTGSMEEDTGWLTWFYGNLPFRSGENVWSTFDHRPRFNNNYIGLRGRIAILSEAYAYDSFRNRVLSTRDFTEDILYLAHAEAGRIAELIARVDATPVTGQQLAVRSRITESSPATEILLGEVTMTRHPDTGQPVLERRDVTRPVVMPEYGAFEPTETSRVPSQWIIPDAPDAIVDALDAHGIIYARSELTLTDVEVFDIDSLQVAERPFQQINEVTVFGRWMRSPEPVSGPAIVVPSRQPLGRLAHYLLDPRSDDGLANWGLLGDALQPDGPFPVYRTIR